MRSLRWWLAAALIFSVAACSNDGGSTSNTDPSTEDDDDAEDDDSDETPRDAASSQARRDGGNGSRDASAAARLDATTPRDAAANARDGESAMIDASAPTTSDARASSGADAASTAAFALTSSVVQEGGTIPGTYRCMMPSPPLSWTAGPSGTESYAVVFRDEANKYYHWLIYDIPRSTSALPMGVPMGAMPAMPMGAKQGPIYNRYLGYAGPCYPSGGPRPYAFTLYALKAATLQGLPANANAMQIVSALEAASLAKATLNIRSVP